jgi:hypothetical protein
MGEGCKNHHKSVGWICSVKLTYNKYLQNAWFSKYCGQ